MIAGGEKSSRPGDPPLDLGAERLAALRVVVVGDACLDLYWLGDMTKSELSRETPHFPLPVIEERVELGAAAHVAQGFAELGVGRVDLVTVVGDDWRGDLLRERLKTYGIDASGVVTWAGGWTPTYVKPLRRGFEADVVYEDPRIDFLPSSHRPRTLEDALLSALNTAGERANAVVVVDQLNPGAVTPTVRTWLADNAAVCPVIVDSRAHIHEFRRVTAKPNQLELWRAVGGDGDPPPPDAVEEWARLGIQLGRVTGGPVVVTLGSAGAVWCRGDTIVFRAAVSVPPPVDVVGAGDAFAVGLAVALAQGASVSDALTLGNVAAAVAVSQIRTAGHLPRDRVVAMWRKVTAT